MGLHTCRFPSPNLKEVLASIFWLVAIMMTLWVHSPESRLISQRLLKISKI